MTTVHCAVELEIIRGSKGAVAKVATDLQGVITPNSPAPGHLTALLVNHVPFHLLAGQVQICATVVDLHQRFCLPNRYLERDAIILLLGRSEGDVGDKTSG